jgi:hypothetical protein
MHKPIGQLIGYKNGEFNATKYLEHIGTLLGCQDEEWCVPVHGFVTASSTNMHMFGVWIQELCV